MIDTRLRAQLQDFLDWESAHAGFDDAVKGIPPLLRGRVPAGRQYRRAHSHRAARHPRFLSETTVPGDGVAERHRGTRASAGRPPASRSVPPPGSGLSKDSASTAGRCSGSPLIPASTCSPLEDPAWRPTDLPARAAPRGRPHDTRRRGSRAASRRSPRSRLTFMVVPASNRPVGRGALRELDREMKRMHVREEYSWAGHRPPVFASFEDRAC